MNRSVLDPADRFRVQHKLDRNETLVWVGRPVPTFRYRGWIGTVIFAVPWCAITGTFVVGVLIPAWMGKPVDGEAWGIWPKLGLTAFLTPFILIGIGTLFSPLWHKLSQQGQLYAVTDKRSFVIGRFFTKSWRGSEMFEPDRADHRNGLSDIWFTYSSTSNNGSHPPTGFSNLLPSDADEAELALRALEGLPRAGDEPVAADPPRDRSAIP